MIMITRKLSFGDRYTCKIFPIKSFSLHKLERFCYGEFRDTYVVLGCLKVFNFLTEQPKVENQTQKIQLKLLKFL